MLGVSLYVIVCSARNRLRARLRRLREPRYLIGAIVGAAYLYFSFFARFRASSSARGRARNPGGPAVFAALFAAGPAIAGLGLLLVTALSWIMPFGSGLLDFSDAEIQFLFPAPVSRRQLLLYRMMRSQIGLLFTSVVTGVVLSSTSGVSRVRTAVAMWLLMVTAKVYFTGLTLARRRLASASARARRVAWLPSAVLGVAVAIVARALSAGYAARAVARLSDLLALVGGVSGSGASRVVLWPFMALARPLFAAWPGPYLAALGWAGPGLAGTVLWVLSIDSAFQETAVAMADRRASEQPSGRKSSYRARSTGWTLAPTGRPETAFAWKAAMQTLRIVDKGTLVRIVAILFALNIAGLSMGRGSGFPAMLGTFAIAATGFAIFMAPQIVRVDLRQDLPNLEVLKTWPIKAAAV